MSNRFIRFTFFLILCTAMIWLPTLSSAQEMQHYLDELEIISREIPAVTTDMYLYLGWGPDEKEAMAEASIQAIKDLDEIKARLEGLTLPDELQEVKLINLKIISELQSIYEGIAQKNLDDVEKDFIAFHEIYTKQNELLKEAFDKYRIEVDLPDNFTPQDEELKYVETEDRETYQTALTKIKEKDYQSAFDILQALKPKYENTPLESCILLRISDCLLMTDTNIPLETIENEELPGLVELTQIVDSKIYSPVMYEAYKKWRTIYQEYNHGMSNMSGIPNKMYNNKRWQMVNRLKEYFKDNPNEQWARVQADLLLSESNILRGGPMGNDNLIYWGTLYSDLASSKEGEEQ